MAAAGVGSRIIGLTFAIPGAWVCIVALFMAYNYRVARDIWAYGSSSNSIMNSIMIGVWGLTVTQYFLLCGVVFVVGATLLGVGVQFCFRAPRDE